MLGVVYAHHRMSSFMGLVKGEPELRKELTMANSTMESCFRGIGTDRITAGWSKAFAWSCLSMNALGRICSLAGSQTMHPGDTWGKILLKITIT
jgi:hypothetical protein